MHELFAKISKEMERNRERTRKTSVCPEVLTIISILLVYKNLHNLQSKKKCFPVYLKSSPPAEACQPSQGRIHLKKTVLCTFSQIFSEKWHYIGFGGFHKSTEVFSKYQICRQAIPKHSKATGEPMMAIVVVVAVNRRPAPRFRSPAVENGRSWLRWDLGIGSRGCGWAYLDKGALHSSQNHQLDGSSQVTLHGHGASQGVHGIMVGAAEKGFAVDGHQLIVHAQTTILEQGE